LTCAAQAEMRPSALTDTDLGDLLHLLGNALAGRINIPVVVTVAPEVVLPPEVQVVFYRICQEALNNITKHAKARHVEIDLQHADGAVELLVRDDGKGFEEGPALAGHFGLGMMRERAEAVGAVLTVTSQPGQGTELKMCWKEVK